MTPVKSKLSVDLAQVHGHVETGLFLLERLQMFYHQHYPFIRTRQKQPRVLICLNCNISLHATLLNKDCNTVNSDGRFLLTYLSVGFIISKSQRY